MCVAMMMHSDFQKAAGATLTSNDNGELLVDAAMESKAEAVLTLVTKGVDVDYADKDGFTALIWGGYNGDVGVVAALLAANANVNLANVDGTIIIIIITTLLSALFLETLVLRTLSVLLFVCFFWGGVLCHLCRRVSTLVR